MRISLRWLADYIDLPTQDVGEIRTALASLGHEVEGVEILGADWAGVVVAEVLTVDPHPNADKVRLCTVTTGGEPMAVVCGAWNFEAGAIVPFAVPGAVLPGGFEIGRREIRGVQSNGMICSERELGLGDDHAGILVLEPDAPVGVDFTEYIELPDVVFDLAITPNRPDAMSMIGIARDLGAFYGVPYRMPSLDTATVAGSPSTAVSIEDPSGVSPFHRPGGSRYHRAAIPAVDAPQAPRRRHAPDLQCGRCHELRDARVGSSAARLRRRPHRRRPPGGPQGGCR